MKSLPHYAHLASALAVAALLAACGGASDDSSDSSDTSAAGETSVRSTRALANDPITSAWAYCTWEGGTCSFTGSRQVRYGTATRNVTRTVTGPVVCSNGTFGDPAPNSPKSCWTSSVTPAAATPPVAPVPTPTPSPVSPTPPAASTTWAYCTYQGGTCTFNGTRQVRYGVGSSWVVRTATSRITCSDGVFGDPAYGHRKTCELGSNVTSTTPLPDTPVVTPPPANLPPPVVTAPTYSGIQMFALANPNIVVQAGQDMTLRVRFFGVRLPDQSKVFTHLYGSNDNYKVADLMHHYKWVPSQSWNGYVEYDYTVNVPISTPPGTYRIGSGIHQGVTPYVGRMSSVTCNGLRRLSTSYATSVQTCHVGSVTVTAPVQAASRATDGPMSMHYATGRTWSPVGL